MNLQKLFQIQKQLDDRIVKEHGLEGQDLLDKKILALQVELGELANEWRGFKFWSKDQEPRNKDIQCHCCKGRGFFDRFRGYTNEHFTEDCGYCDGTGVQERNPLLEEYVDCLHFILSIGLEIKDTSNVNLNIDYGLYETNRDEIIGQFSLIYKHTWNVHGDYESLAGRSIELGQMLGFTWEQIETAYLDKNKINHERQANGY